MATKSGPTSYVVLASLQLIFMAVLMLSLTTPTEANWRTWPVPPIPPELVTNTNNVNIYEEVVKPWQFYLIYLALVLVVPLIFTIAIFSITFCCGCVRCCLHCIPTPITKKNLSTAKIRFYSLVPYAIGYAILFVCTALSIGFFIWFLIGWMHVRSVAYTTAKEGLDLPDNVVAAAKEISGVIPTFMNNFRTLLTDVTDISGTITMISDSVATTKDAIGGISVHLDNNFEAYTKVKNRQTQMVARTSGSDNPMDAVDFGAFDSFFMDSANSIGSTVNNSLDQIVSVVNGSTTQVNNVLNQVDSHILSMNSTILSTIDQLISQVEQLMDTGRTYYSDYFSHSSVNTYELWTRVGEGVFAAVIIVILTVVLALMTCGFLFIFLRCWPCIKLCNLCACCCILLYGIVGAVCLFLWFLTSDICTQGEKYVVRVEESMNVPPFRFQKPTGGYAEVKYSDAFLGVMKCQNSNFLNASGLSLDTFDLPGFIRQYEGTFTDALHNFNIQNFLNTALGNTTQAMDNIMITEAIGTQVTNLKSTITTTINTFFATFPLSLTQSDFENHDNTLSQLNAILSTYSIPPYIGSTVERLAPAYYNTNPNPTPGKIVAGGPGDDFTSVLGLVADNTHKNAIWGSLARDGSNVQFAPGSVELGLVSLLTRMNAPAPVYAKETYDDYVALLVELTELVESVNQTEIYAKDIFDFSPVVNDILNHVNETFNNAVGSITAFIYNSVDTLTNKVDGLEVLKCDVIGNCYYAIEKSYCGNLYIALGGTAVTALITVGVLGLIFILLLHADILAFRKKRANNDFDDESFEDNINQLDNEVDALKADAASFSGSHPASMGSPVGSPVPLLGGPMPIVDSPVPIAGSPIPMSNPIGYAPYPGVYPGFQPIAEQKK